MARDYEDIHDLDSLSDDELRELVVQHLRANNFVDVDDITVGMQNGTLILSGRIGTDEERRVAEHIVTDSLGIQNYRNELVVDDNRRAVSPEAVDDHLADEEEHEGLLLGDRPASLSPEAEHLEDDLDAELFGTTDVQQAIEGATAWIPPESPTPEGHSDGTRAE